MHNFFAFSMFSNYMGQYRYHDNLKNANGILDLFTIWGSMIFFYLTSKQRQANLL